LATPFITRETVATETPAWAATVEIETEAPSVAALRF
jgi:hypothetical protein